MQYKLDKTRAGEELAELCREHGYALSWSTKRGRHLTWGRAQKHGAKPFEELFPAFEILEYGGEMYPKVRFNTLNLGHGPAGLEQGGYTVEDLGRHMEKRERKLQAMVDYYREKQRNGESIEAQLAATRDALEKQVLRFGDVLQEPFAKAKSVLKVWVNKAERALLDGQAVENLGPPFYEWAQREGIPGEPDALPKWKETERGRVYDFYKQVRILWRLLTRGIEHDNLGPYLDRELFSFGAPEAVCRSAKTELVHLHEHIHDVTIRTLRIDEKRCVYERVLLHVLEDEAIPGWEEMKVEIERPKQYKSLFKRAKVEIIPLLLKTNGQMPPMDRDEWKSKNRNDLFVELEERFENWNGDPPAILLAHTFTVMLTLGLKV